MASGAIHIRVGVTLRRRTEQPSSRCFLLTKIMLVVTLSPGGVRTVTFSGLGDLVSTLLSAESNLQR